MSAATTRTPTRTTSTSTDTAADLYVALGRLVRVLRQPGAGTPVGPGGFSALVSLERVGTGLRLGALAETEHVSAPSMTRIVAVLVEHGLVVRRPDELDGRAQLVELTAEGRRVVTGGLESRVDLLRARIDALPDDLRAGLAAAVPAIEALAAPPT